MMDFVEEYLLHDLEAYNCAFNNHTEHICLSTDSGSGFDQARFNQSFFA